MSRRAAALGEAMIAHRSCLVGGEEGAAASALALPQNADRGTGGEFKPPAALGMVGLEDAASSPSSVALFASIERVELAEAAGVFDLALDLAQSAGAKNAVERMMLHQMAAAHRAAMRAIERYEDQKHLPEAAKLLNSAARLMAVFQQGAIALQRIRTNGNQTMTVQHVHVEAGGQALVGNVTTGGSNGRG